MIYMEIVDGKRMANHENETYQTRSLFPGNFVINHSRLMSFDTEGN